ncbi:unnamed protein product [Didymodactylos carnosus]|uniref:BEN domain-containing protein n=1 Tax=Didymodactylos carnosus TaxID=1234261 RepID=A0A814UWX9_9BILA|nr:unnamed protein product [Didymodactylos carnosus]CAF3944613.1 unnamed protein product [Didymodactylos carnosus]
MSETKKVRAGTLEIVEGSDESDFEQGNNNKITILSIVNEKFDLLLTKFDKIETSVNTLKKTDVDTLIIKQTTIDITVCELQKDNVDKSASIINTENCCTKILELIEERALSFENAIQHASEQINEQVVRTVPCGTDTTQSTSIDNPTFATVSAPPTPTEIITSANELLYSHYDFEPSESFTSKRPYDMNVDNDEAFMSTPDSANRLLKRQKADSQISTNMCTNLFASVTTSNEPQVFLNDPTTQRTFQVAKGKHDRQQLATNQELLNKETGFRHLLAYLFSTLFTEEELKVSSVDASVRGTKAFDPIRVAAIDKHLFDLYGARYTKYRTSNQYKELLNKKCNRIRTKFNKNINNY